MLKTFLHIILNSSVYAIQIFKKRMTRLLKTSIIYFDIGSDVENVKHIEIKYNRLF